MLPRNCFFFILICLLLVFLYSLPVKLSRNKVRIRRYITKEKCYKYKPSKIDVKRDQGGLRTITVIDEGNLDQVNCGEWLVVLCSKIESGCIDFKRILQRMPITTDDVGLAFGDLSEDPYLRFRMSAFEPITVYHVLDGKFRRLDSKQDVFSLRDIIRLRFWTDSLPLKFWAHPTSKFTNLYIYFYKAAAKLLGYGYVHNNYKVGAWSILLGFAGLLITGFWTLFLWCNPYFKRRQP